MRCIGAHTCMPLFISVFCRCKRKLGYLLLVKVRYARGAKGGHSATISFYRGIGLNDSLFLPCDVTYFWNT